MRIIHYQQSANQPECCGLHQRAQASCDRGQNAQLSCTCLQASGLNLHFQERKYSIRPTHFAALDCKFCCHKLAFGTVYVMISYLRWFCYKDIFLCAWKYHVWQTDKPLLHTKGNQEFHFPLSMSVFDKDTNHMGVPQLLLHQYQCWHGLYGHQCCDERYPLFPSSNVPSGIDRKTIHS